MQKPKKMKSTNQREHIGNLAKLGIKMGSETISSALGKKRINEGITHALDLYKCGASKIRNKKVQKAVNPDIANYIVTETQKKANDNLNNLFGGV